MTLAFTDYAPTSMVWRAVEFDGTNAADIVDFANTEMHGTNLSEDSGDLYLNADTGTIDPQLATQIGSPLNPVTLRGKVPTGSLVVFHWQPTDLSGNEFNGDQVYVLGSSAFASGFFEVTLP
jgi:hypothetical protein